MKKEFENGIDEYKDVFGIKKHRKKRKGCDRT